MTTGTAKNNLVTHGDLGELAYANWADVLKPQVQIADTTVYLRTPISASASNAPFSITTTYYSPILLSEPKALTQLSVKSGSGHTGTTSLRLGIWQDNKGLPASLIQDAGLVSMTAANSSYAATFTELVLPAGLYWVGCNAISISGTLQMVGSTASTVSPNALLGYISASSAGSLTLGRTEAYNATTSFGAAGATSAGTTVPHIWAKLT